MIIKAPLSQSQYGIYADCVSHENEAYYNLPYLYVLDGSLDAARLCRAIETAVMAHPTLFTRIELDDDGEPLQTINMEKEHFSLSVEQITDIEAEKQKLIVPFKIYGERLFHIRLLRDQEHLYWLLDLHHIIGDGTTLKVMLHDVEKAYNGETIEPEQLTMAELATAEAELRKTEAFEEGKRWYAQNFDCSDTYTPLMPDLEIPEHSEASTVRILNIDMARVDDFCKTNGIFKSNLFTTVYSFLLAKYNNEQESLFTTVYNGRTDKRFLNSVGMTVKTLPVYAKFTDETTVLEFLNSGQEQMRGCREHDVYAFGDVMADLNLQSNSMFVWHGTLFADEQLIGKPMQTIRLCNSTLEASLYLKAFILNNQYHVKAEYNSNEYSEVLISTFLESYEAALEGFLTQTYLRDINICTKSQCSVLDSFNHTDTDLDLTETVVSKFRRQVAQTPDNIAVVYKDKRYTYKEVDEISDRIAAYIHGQGLQHEDVVSVLIPRCEWMAIASLGVVKTGCAYQPLDPSYPAERLNFMMKDASAKLLIADEELRPLVNEYQGEVLLIENGELKMENEPTSETNSLFSILNSQLIKPSSLFIMLYTSGSTGTPKGCQLEHRNIAAFCEWYQHKFSLTADCRITAYASYGFDACMMDLYPALTCGATVYIIPEELRLDLVALNEYFEKEQITHAFMTTQVAYQFATSIENHSLRYLLTGGEKLAQLTPPANYTLVNIYGPTECTVCVTTFNVTEVMKDIPIGAALDNIKLYVVDKAGHRLPVGAAGELWVAGPQVSRGYLNRPDKTAEVYIANPFETNEKYARIYRTGDIVRYLPDGNIQFVGRKDGQVKIRGFRIELKEVESVIRQFPGIKDATVQAFDEEGGGKFIAAYIVSDEQIDIEAMNNFIMEEKPPYMVPAVTMQIDKIPLNQNQKVNKKALPKPEKKAAEAMVESNVPMNIMEEELHEIVAGIVGAKDFGVTTVLGYVGLTSISAIKLTIQLNKRFGVTLDAKTLVKAGTLQSIENEIWAKMMNGEVEPQSVEKEISHADLSKIPLSYAQLGVYVECMNQQDSTVYNIPTLIGFPKDTDTDLLARSVETLIKAHPQLMAHFDNDGDETIQVVDLEQPIEIVRSRMNENELAQYKREFVRPFSLSQGPLYRMEIVTTEKRVCLLADVHHLVFDGGSYDLFMNQLCDLMAGQDIEAETFYYADYVASEKAAEGGTEHIAARDFFQERLGKVEGVTEVSSDLTNPIDQGTLESVCSYLDFNKIEDFCRQHNITPAHFTLAAVFYTLSRFTNNDQLCITTISNGRSDLRIRNTVGMFVNTLALSANVGKQSVSDFLTETSENFDETLRHENYPFAQIASDYDLSAEIMFAYQVGVINSYVCNGQPLEIENLELNVPKFRIAFYIKNVNGKPAVCIEYDNGRYSRELMQSMALSVCNAVSAFMQQPDVPLQQVSLLDAKQTALLDSFNQTDVPYDDTQNIVSLFRRQVMQTPDNIAVVYKDKRYTYKEVEDISDRIATYIHGQGLQGEDVVSVLIPRCEWMAIASLGVVKTGCAYQPLDPSYPAERLNFMMKDASAKLLIADEELRPLVNEYQGEVLLIENGELKMENEPTSETNSQFSILNSQSIKPSSLFIMLYTSGTTGTPKGCQLLHRNITAFCEWYHRKFSLTADCRVSAYASYGFDACMMDLYPALTCGATVHIIPEELRLDLVALNEYFEKEHITHAFMTTQVAYQFATSIENHSLCYLLTGGEKLAQLTPPANYTLVNIYGPTECTVCVTTFNVTEVMKDIPIGAALDNIKLYVVDKAGHRLPVGAAGELWVAGPQVSRGYLNRPEKTAEVYIANPFETNEKYAHIYRTGDIVRYLPDGNIQFVGRKDGQVKIRGFRIELKEVETVIRQFPGIKDATVQAFDEDVGGKYIAAYIVSDEQIDIEAMNNFIMEEKPPYMVPAVTMQIDRIPLNQNQKVNKKALPKPEKKAAETVVENNVPMNILEEELHEIVAGIVGTKDFGVTTVLGYVGLTSISAIKLAVQLNKRFGVTLDAKSLVKNGSVQSIENEILDNLLNTSSPSQTVSGSNNSEFLIHHSELKSVPLSYAQMGVYVECMKQPTSTFYNIPSLIGFPKETDTALLARSVETIIKAHPQFMAHFDSVGSEIVQIVDFNQTIDIIQSQMNEDELTQYKQEFVRPFRLSQGPLYRMEIVTTEKRVCLLADVHHLVFDGGSYDLFMNQLCDLMNGHEIEAEIFSYADFVAAEKAAESSAEHIAARDFFQKRLGKVEGVTEVPSDLTNPIDQGTTESVYSYLDFNKIENFCRHHNITPAHLSLAAVFYTLSRFTNNEQLCITTISSGRSDLRIRNTVGMFVNTLALSANVGEQHVSDFLMETSENFDETLRHENYPFAQIAADYDLSAEIMFAYQVGVINNYVCNSQLLEVETLELNTPKFRIAFYIKNINGKPAVYIEYDNGRYSRELMQSMAQSVSNAAAAFVLQPEIPLQQVSLLDAEQTALLDSFNLTDVPYDDSQTIVSLFRRQVEQTPDNMAVVYHEKQYTYREVDEISERIAGYLVSQGLGNEDVVSVLIPRCEWMAIVSLGVLKAGCAYQPLDPSYPAERLNFMMKDASAKLLIADEELRPIVNEYQGKVLLIENGELKMENEPTSETNSQFSIPNSQLIKPSSLFIMLYTSGSTGTPKGCQLEHGNLVAFCHWYQRYYGLTAADRVAAYASYGFDACLMDLYPALTCGACVYIIGDDIRLNLPDLNDYFNKQGITHSFITTQVGYQFATNVENHSLRCFAVGGEKLSAINPPKNYKMYNGYGPTECTIFTTNYWVKDYEMDIPIGKPLDNMKLYIVDKQFNRLPLGAAGELWVTGPQVSRGYLNRPEKTAETYLKNPFSNDPKHARVYRTGDIVRYLPDGNIQFVGRKDGQVKIRGFRIEMKEVEAVIRQYPGIKDVTVQAFDYENGGKYIAAYIVSDSEINVKDLNTFIGQQKPPYMVPAATMQIDAIPLNQNQKVNRKALPAPVIQPTDREYVAPANDTEQLFCRIFSEILSMDKIGATDNFFDLGGTSLMVTRVIIEADKAGMHVAYGDVFSNATPRMLAALVIGNTVISTVEEDVTNFDYSAINNVLSNNTLYSFLNGERQQLGNALLTGATGYLGIHVLYELIKSDAPKIYCLVRDKSLDSAEHRLKTLLFYYFESTYDELFDSRLHVILGDVTNDLTSLVQTKIDTVFNCAAVVKHFSEGTEIEDVNIGGAQRCVDFCLKTGARLVHISTASTRGLNVNSSMAPDYIFTEQKLYGGQYLGNQYIHSKFIAERIVLQAIAENGLSAKVIRVGNLAARASDGEFQINFSTNAFMGRIKVYNMLGCFPYSLYEKKVEFSPIDEVAQSIILLSSTPKECCVFHAYNSHTQFFGDVLTGFGNLGTDIRLVEDEEYNTTLENASNDPQKAKTLSSLLAYQDMAHGMKASDVTITNPYTTQVLYRLGFKWSPTTWDYVDRMLNAINGLGFFD